MRFRKLWILPLLSIFLITLVAASSAIAGTVGKISGVVTDEKGEPIPGVSVKIENTTMGAAAGIDGSYVILNVPPGTFSVSAQTVGYNKTTAQGVEVQADVTTQQNFKLTSSAIETKPVIVTAPIKTIDRFKTTNDFTKTADQIKTMPVTNLGQLLKSTPGFVKEGGLLHSRGGRAGEISYIVDGIEVKDPLGGYGVAQRQAVDIASSEIEQLSVLKGNFDAEYGGVNSAIINVVGKGGDTRTTSGRIEFLTDDFGMSSLNKYSFNSDRLEWNLSGPIPGISDVLFPAMGLKWPGEKMAYFISFSGDKSNSYVDYNNYPSANSKVDYGYEKFLGIKIPNRKNNSYSANAKLTWQMDENGKYKLSTNYRKLWQKFNGFSYSYLYTPSTAPTIDESKEIYGAAFTFSPGFLKNTYGELKINRFIQHFEERPGSRTPGDFVNSEHYESYTDVNNNGQWDQAEPYIDTNHDGFFGEPFEDLLANGVYDTGEPFTDLNGNRVYDSDIGEPYSDLNRNGKYDRAEPITNDQTFFDANHNGKYDHSGDPFKDYNGDGVRDPEPFTDVNGNGIYNPEEPFVDANHNGTWDTGEIFNDLNGNGVWDAAEPFVDLNHDGKYYDEPYEDINKNGSFDFGDFAYTDSLGRGNGVYDPQLQDVTRIDVAEPFTDGDKSLGEPFIDVNLDGRYNGPESNPAGHDIFKGAWDLNNNGRHDGPNDTWSAGIPYQDLNNNGRYDAPNGRYDYGEPFVDVNGNGIYDQTDGFWDSGFDQYGLWQMTKTTTNTFSLNLTSQVSKQHEIKSGLEYKDMTLDMNEIQYPDQTYNGNSDGGLWPDRGYFRDFYTRTPKQGSFYIRDKMEYGEMIADLGFRYEFYLQANEVLDSTFNQDNYQGRTIFNSRNKFSPRVSFSFPVAEKAKLYFNYGHFYQLPDLQNMFMRPTQASNTFGLIGNPNLDFQKTISYELGIQYSIAQGYVLDLSGFYKDYYGLLSSVREVYGPITTDIYSNVDYARTRGLEMQLEKRYGDFFAGSLNYQYTWAFGKNASSMDDYIRRVYNEEIPIQERPLDWDIRHQITVNADIRAAKNTHPKFGILTLPDDWTLNFIWQFKTGKPYTPDASFPGLVLVGREKPLGNSKRMGNNSTVDVRYDKNFQAWKLNYTVTVSIQNIFDTRNVNGVYSNTGLAYTNRNVLGQIETGLSRDTNPANYDPGRQIQFGMSLNF